MGQAMKRVGPMHNPPHPGEILNELVIVPLGISVTDAADAIGVSRKTLSQLLNARIGVSSMMAIRVGLATNTTAESWLTMQTAYDLWQVRKATKRVKVKKLVAA
jgi:addiction module HigA family antidote